jgi:hypothetical protein
MPWVEMPSKEFRRFIKTNMSEQDAFDLEYDLIKHYGRKIDGGILENVKLTRWVSQAGWKHSTETKEKISKANKGRVFSEETKAKYRKPKSKEHAEKIRQANLGRKDDGRHAKIGKVMSLKRWYNNSQVSRMFVPGYELEGFYPGRKRRNTV